MKIIDRKKCLICKGRLWCGLKYCPIILKKSIKAKVLKKIENKDSIEGFSYNLFVSRYNYPRIPIGVLTSSDKLVNHPKDWIQNKFTIKDIVFNRVNLINAKKSTTIVGLDNPIIEAALSKRPTYVYIKIKKIKTNLCRFYPDYYPMGPSTRLLEIEFLEEPKIPRIVEKLYYDQIKAEDAVYKLYEKDFDFYKISEVLSGGLLGINKRLVPTRWAITAVDSIIGKKLKKEVMQYKLADKYMYFEGSLLGNYIFAVYIPYPFSFEYTEIWMPHTTWNLTNRILKTTDHEFYFTQPPKEPKSAGAYYAARLAFLEFLKKNKINGSFVVLRVITRDYYLPLGVWVVRECARKATENPISFNDMSDLITFLRNRNKLILNMLENSNIIKQTKLVEF